jgi:hypothetical protein
MSGVLTICGRLKSGGLAGNKRSTFLQNKGVCQHRRGGCIPTKQGNFRPCFAPANTLQTQNSRESVLFAPKTVCLSDKFNLYSYPTEIPTHREVVLCTEIIDIGSKIGSADPNCLLPTTHYPPPTYCPPPTTHHTPFMVCCP